MEGSGGKKLDLCVEEILCVHRKIPSIIINA
jgi:hypothetical protein